jgi:hypothetical protein
VAARITIALSIAALMLAAASTAFAAPASVPETTTYDLTFTLPTAGASGCTVCHGDPNLVRPVGDTTRSLYVGPEVLGESAHKDILCSNCHIDFAYKLPHENVVNGTDWRGVAKAACKNCHSIEAGEVAIGAHSPSGIPGEDAAVTAARRAAAGKPAVVPACGDCHGSHDIMHIAVERHETSGTAEVIAASRVGRANLQASGERMCGQCHTDMSDAYDDYYHGAAYRRGATDAPACWDCHDAHQMLPASDRRSPVHPSNLIETCGKCHSDVNEKYIEYADLVHRRADVEAGVPIFAFFDSTRTVLRGAIETVTSWFQR